MRSTHPARCIRLWPAVLAASSLWIAAGVSAAVPNRLNYQGKLTDDKGVAVADGSYAMMFGLYSQASGGAPVWTEGQRVSVRDGIFSVELGAVNTLPDFFQQYYIETQVGSDPPLPRQQLVGAAYAQAAARPAPGSIDSNAVANASIVGTDLASSLITSAGDEVLVGSLTPDDRTASLVAPAVPCPAGPSPTTSFQRLCSVEPVAQAPAQALVIVRLDQEARCAESGSATTSHRFETHVELRRQGSAVARGVVGTSAPAPDLPTVSASVAVPIPDNNPNGVDIPINVPNVGAIDDVDVRVRLNHTFDGDLILSLVHPDGTVVVLSNRRGASGDNYGNGPNSCSGGLSTFDDSAESPISAGTPPFLGSFRPDQSLSALNGKSSQGRWILRVQDAAAEDVGTVGCVQLAVNSRAADSLTMVHMLRLDNNNPLEVWARWSNVSSSCGNNSAVVRWNNIKVWIAYLGLAP